MLIGCAVAWMSITPAFADTPAPGAPASPAAPGASTKEAAPAPVPPAATPAPAPGAASAGVGSAATAVIAPAPPAPPAKDVVSIPTSPAHADLAPTGATLPLRDTALLSRLSALEQRVSKLESAQKEIRDERPKTSGLIPHVLIGPKLSLISLPTPGVGVEAKAFEYFGASFDYGFIPSVTISNTSVQMNTWRASANVYPFRGSFLIGAGIGSYDFEARTTVSDSSGSTTPATATVKSTFLEPHIGWRSIGPSGFFTAVDLGWKFPLSYTSTVDAPAGSTGTAQDIKSKADQYVKGGVPAIGLLQVGWFL